MAAAVSLTVHFRDGSSNTISQPVGQGNAVVRYDQLIQSLGHLQEQTNNILTSLVNQEKAQKNNSESGLPVSDHKKNSSSSNGDLTNSNDGNDGSDDDDEDSEDDDSDDKPPEKRRKT